MGNQERFSRGDLARELAKRRADLHADQALGIIDTIFLTIAERVADGDSVTIRGFGSFSTRELKGVRRIWFKQSSVVKTTFMNPQRRRKTSKR